MRKTIASVGLALIATCTVAPAQAIDEPVPAPKTPLEACEQTRDALENRVFYWESQSGAYEELYLSYVDSHEVMARVAEQWQSRALIQGREIDRLTTRNGKLKAKVAELRAKIDAIRN